MATTKIKYRSYKELTSRSNNNPNYEVYTTEKAELYTGLGVQKNHVFESFKTHQDVHHKYRDDFFAAEIIQSFDPKISKPGSEKLFHSIGVDLAQRLYPGFQIAVITHTDKAHYHNHILVNPVHPETGRRLDKGHFRWTNIRKLNDQLMRENGIPVVERRGPKTAQIHHKAMKMLVNGEVPVTYDLIQKLDVARSVSRNLEEFKMVLGKFGIQTRIAGETISYTHPDRKKACKARTLGTNYTLDSINKNLEYNADAYRSKPWLLDEQIKRLDSVENKKSVNHGSFHFINYIDQTGHQVIQERAEFLRNLPNLVKQRNFNNLYRKVGTLLRDSGDERSSTQRALLSDFKQQKEERELSLSISPQENKQRSKSDHSLEIEQDDFGIDL